MGVDDDEDKDDEDDVGDVADIFPYQIDRRILVGGDGADDEPAAEYLIDDVDEFGESVGGGTDEPTEAADLVVTGSVGDV